MTIKINLVGNLITLTIALIFEIYFYKRYYNETVDIPNSFPPYSVIWYTYLNLDYKF